MALGRVVLPRRAIAATSAREGEKARNMLVWTHFYAKSRKKLVQDVFLVVDYDYDLKLGGQRSPGAGRFFEKLRFTYFHTARGAPAGSRSFHVYIWGWKWHYYFFMIQWSTCTWVCNFSEFLETAEEPAAKGRS